MSRNLTTSQSKRQRESVQPILSAGNELVQTTIMVLPLSGLESISGQSPNAVCKQHLEKSLHTTENLSKAL